MRVFTSDKIRNVVLLGHGGSGKTSLAESMAYLSGLKDKAGSVEAGNTISDYDGVEKKHKFSVHLSLLPLIWGETKINLLDTPGYPDFVGEVEEAVSVADAAVIVVSGKNGIEVGTRKAWNLCEKYHLPRIIFVTDMDIDEASYRQVIEDLQALYGKKIAPFHLPIRENGQFVGYVNIIQQKAKRWNATGGIDKMDVPDYSYENLDQFREVLLEAVAETSETYMDRYFNGDTFSEDEIRQAMRVSVIDGSVVPVMMGSNLSYRGMYTLMADIVKYLPSPDRRSCVGIDPKTNEAFEADYDFSKPKSAYVFKTLVDPFVGQYSMIKVNSGVLKTDDLLYNAGRDREDKIGKIYLLTGSKAQEVSELHAGDIGALSRVADLSTGDSLSTRAHPVTYLRPVISKPYCYLAYQAEKSGDDDKLQQALQKIAREDLTLRTQGDPANHQSLIYGISRAHLELIAEILADKYKLTMLLDKPLVAYRETILGKSDVEYKHKKQTGGHGQYGHVKMTFEPSGDLSVPFVFEEKVVGGSVPKNYFPAVEKGLAERVLEGPLAGYPIYGVKATLYDGSYHPVDSSEAAFKTAASMAMKEGILQAKPILLEPIASLEVTVADERIGDVMGDLNKRRGRVMSLDPIEGGYQVVRAEVPYSALYEYGTNLRSLTSGDASYSYEFLRYDPCPADVQEAQISIRSAQNA